MQLLIRLSFEALALPGSPVLREPQALSQAATGSEGPGPGTSSGRFKGGLFVRTLEALI